MQERLQISLSAARINAGMSQDEAAKRLEIGKSSLQNYEKGVTIPRLDMAYKMAELYDMPVTSIKFF